MTVASVGTGLYADEETAIAAMTRPAATFTPDASMRAHYDRRYSLWTRLTKTLDPLWRELAQSEARA